MPTPWQNLSVLASGANNLRDYCILTTLPTLSDLLTESGHVWNLTCGTGLRAGLDQSRRINGLERSWRE